MAERRKHPRYDVTVPVHVTVGKRKQSQVLRGATRNISREGVAIEIHEDQDTMEAIHYLVSLIKTLKLVVELPPSSETVSARGTVQWWDIGLISDAECYLRVGIHLGQMSADDRTRWRQFINSIGSVQKESQRLETRGHIQPGN